MKVKVSEATGAVLDWMVAKAEGALAPTGNLYFVGRQLFIGVGGDLGPLGSWVLFSPSTDPAQAWPIIEREKIEWQWLPSSDKAHQYGARKPSLGGLNRTFCMDGPTILVAAMRCYVASKLGDEVEIPEELL